MKAVGKVKYCPQCKKKRLLKFFFKDKSRSDRLAHHCKKCQLKRGWSYSGRNEASKRSYYKHRKERLKASIRRSKRRLKVDVLFRIKKNLRHRLYNLLKGCRKSKSTMTLVGCSIEQLRTYFESKFKPGMTWSNYGKSGWEVDHIKPCASFDLNKEEEQKKCFHYTNLQPLWKSENASKQNKIL